MTIVAFHRSSSVPPTIRRFSASSLVRRVASAVTSACRRVASSACAWTTSIGAMVPISTLARLSCTSFDESSRLRLRRFDVVDPEDEVPVGVADRRFGDGQRRAQVEIGDLRLQSLIIRLPASDRS